MPNIEFHCELNAPLARVWAFHNTVETLFKLTPPEFHAQLEGVAEPMRQGAVYRIRVRQFGIVPIRMVSEIVEYTPPNGFVDVQAGGPFKTWSHRHRFEALPGDRTRLTDSIHYALPFGPLGLLADRLFVRRTLEQMFAYRHRMTRETVEGSRAI